MKVLFTLLHAGGLAHLNPFDRIELTMLGKVTDLQKISKRRLTCISMIPNS